MAKGTSSSDSYAVKVDDANWDIGMVVVVVNKKQKELSSREGMKLTVATSPFYQGWIDSTAVDLVNIKNAINDRDFEQIGAITESNGMKMHGTMLGANPPISYWEPDSVLAMQLVRQLRKKEFLVILRWMQVQTSKSFVVYQIVKRSKQLF